MNHKVTAPDIYTCTLPTTPQKRKFPKQASAPTALVIDKPGIMITCYNCELPWRWEVGQTFACPTCGAEYDRRK